MNWDAIIGLSAAPALILLVTVVVRLCRRRRKRRSRSEQPSAEAYRSPLLLKVTGWVLAPIGLFIGLMGVALRGTGDEGAAPMMAVGGVIVLLGAVLIERTGSVFWLTDETLVYRKPLRGGTIPYVDVRDYGWSTSTTGSPALTAAHVTITTSNGRRIRFNISLQHSIDWSPLHKWAEAHQRRDLLPASSAAPSMGPRHR